MCTKVGIHYNESTTYSLQIIAAAKVIAYTYYRLLVIMISSLSMLFPSTKPVILIEKKKQFCFSMEEEIGHFIKRVSNKQ